MYALVGVSLSQVTPCSLGKLKRRNWASRHAPPSGYPSSAWRWIQGMVEPKNCVIPPSSTSIWKSFFWKPFCFRLRTSTSASQLQFLMVFREDFREYADVCFREFGDRVKYWSTLNEPNIVSLGGYDQGIIPPERCSYPFGLRNCTAGNSSVEPYIATHNQLLAHAEAARVYKEKYQASSNTFIDNLWPAFFTSWEEQEERKTEYYFLHRPNKMVG